MKYFTGDIHEDSLMMTTILSELEYYSGSERKGMTVDKHPKDGGSMLYSATWRGPYLSPTKQREFDEETGFWKTKIYAEHPELKAIFKEYANIYFPDFQYISVQMNKNFRIKKHTDSMNMNESVLCCFGDYTGGETCVDYDGEIIKYEPRDKPVMFNGSKYTHWVEPFVGTRYSLVFFSNAYLLKRIAKRNALKVLGL